MRKGVLILVLALALVLAGCKGGDKGSASSSSTPFIGGSEGLKVSFVENAPPNEVLDNPLEKTKPVDKSQVMNFDIILKVENVGEQDIAGNALKATIGGIYPNDFGKTSTDLQNVNYVELKKKVNPLMDTSNLKLDGVKKDPEGGKIPGSIEEMTFKDLGYVKSLEGNNEFPIQADLCYKYTTRAVGDFCMRQDLTKSTAGVCSIKGAKPVFSSGSPIQVASLEESVGGRSKVILKFKIKALGTGSFFKPEQIGATIKDGCDKGNFAEENFVKVTISSGVEGLRCSGFSTGADKKTASGDVRLSNGEASVTCTQDNILVDAVQKVNIWLEYNHLISASTKVLVKHLPDEFAGTPPPAAPAGSAGQAAVTQSQQGKVSGQSVCSQAGMDVPQCGGCENTGGTWSLNTRSCTCPSGKRLQNGICLA